MGATSELRVFDGDGGAAERLPTLAAQLTPEQKELLRRTAGAAADLSDDEFVMFLTVANRLGLDPLTKQIVAWKVKNSRSGKQDMVIVTAITGMRTVSQRAGLDDGMEGPYFTGDGLNWSEVWLDKLNPPAAAKCVIYRKGASHPYTGTVSWEEYAKVDDKGKPRDFWKNMPSLMLGKCAEALARREAFSDKLSGVYAPEEFGATSTSQVVDVQRPGKPPALTGPQNRSVATGTGGQSEKPDDRGLAPAVYELMDSLPVSAPPVTTDEMKAMFKEGGRARQFTELLGRHMQAEAQACQHLSERVTEAAGKLGLHVTPPEG